MDQSKRRANPGMYFVCLLGWSALFGSHARAEQSPDATPPAVPPAVAAGDAKAGFDAVGPAPAIIPATEVEPAASPAGVPAPGPADLDSASSQPAAPPTPVAAPELADSPVAPAIASPAPVAPAPEPARQVAAPLTLVHPTVTDTAHLASGAQQVALFGVVGIAGDQAQAMQGYLASSNAQLSCQPQAGADFVCVQPDGSDLAEFVLFNGGGRAADNAPPQYLAQEAAAQAARRGIWSNLPPPPVTLSHPVVQDTATLFVNNTTYALDGIQGLGVPYSTQLQSYVSANGDSVNCVPQPVGTYVCMMPDGTDLAKAALVNGAARIQGEAPDAYRIQQRDAMTAHRGYWFNPPPADLQVTLAMYAQPGFCCDFAPAAVVEGGEVVDGLSYVNGVPMAVIDGEAAALVFAGAAVGWGFYDHAHRWHGAPDRFRGHLERFHPEGHGLHGYEHGGYGHVDQAHFVGHGGPGFGRPMAGPAVFHPAPMVPAMHPGMAGPAGVHPAMAAPVGVHPGMPGPVGARPGMAGPVGARPGMAPAIHPAAAAAPAMRAPAPAPHISAPAPHASAPSKKK